MNIKVIEQRGGGLSKYITEHFILNPPEFKVSDYQSLTNFKNKLIFIPSGGYYIPCLFYRKPESSNILIYFHGNSEHIFQIEHYGLDFRTHLEMNVIIVEYPGYSIYNSQNPDPNIMLTDALTVCKFVNEKLNFKLTNIFVCGRSIGTCPAIYLASQIRVKALFLISAFTSIIDIGKDKYTSFSSLFLEDIFQSYQYIKEVKCHTLFIHGKKDELIRYKHSDDLKNELIKNNVEAEIYYGENNDHNNFYLRNDIIKPIKDFIEKHNLKTKDQTPEINENELKEFKMPESISRKIESKIFNIENFEFYKRIDINNVNFLMKLIDGRIVLINGSKILIYDKKKLILDEEIVVNNNNNNNDMIINCIFQMKNENLVCGTNSGDIIIYEIDIDSEMYKEKKHIKKDKAIIKIDRLSEGLICILTMGGITIYNDFDFNENDSINLKEYYSDFIHISLNLLVMLNDNYVSTIDISKKEETRKKYFDIYAKRDALIATDKYLILGGKKCIYHMSHSLDIINESQIEGNINNIQKIHNELFLASTSNGEILQINIIKEDENETLKVNKKYCTRNEIYFVLLNNISSILFCDKDGISMWITPKKEEVNCILI